MSAAIADRESPHQRNDSLRLADPSFLRSRRRLDRSGRRRRRGGGRSSRLIEVAGVVPVADESGARLPRCASISGRPSASYADSVAFGTAMAKMLERAALPAVDLAIVLGQLVAMPRGRDRETRRRPRARAAGGGRRPSTTLPRPRPAASSHPASCRVWRPCRPRRPRARSRGKSARTVRSDCSPRSGAPLAHRGDAHVAPEVPGPHGVRRQRRARDRLRLPGLPRRVERTTSETCSPTETGTYSPRRSRGRGGVGTHVVSASARCQPRTRRGFC